jgi:hypothetical protein
MHHVVAGDAQFLEAPDERGADVIRDGTTMQIRLGEPPAPVPGPFAALLTSYLTTRPNLATATNPDSSLLFPGRRAGQPMHPTTLRLRLAAAGIPDITSRTALGASGTNNLNAARTCDDGQLNLPRSGHVELPGDGQRDYIAWLLSIVRSARSRLMRVLGELAALLTTRTEWSFTPRCR